MDLDEIRDAARRDILVLGTWRVKNHSGQLILGVDPLADAVAFKERNPEAYRAMVELARFDIQHGHKPSTKLYIEMLRRPHIAEALEVYVTRMPGPVKIPNALSSGLARLIMREHPDIIFPLAKAKVDSW